MSLNFFLIVVAAVSVSFIVWTLAGRRRKRSESEAPASRYNSISPPR